MYLTDREVIDMSNQKMDNAVFLQIRIEKDIRDKYRQICKKYSLNSSDLLRKYIENFVKEHEKVE